MHWLHIVSVLLLGSSQGGLDAALSNSLGEATRDASLQGLADIFNHHSQLFEHWKIKRPSKEHHQAFIDDILSAWLFLEPNQSIRDHVPRSKDMHTSASTAPLNCTSVRYDTVFTGEQEAPGEEKIIIDFIPFGYDIDLLEVRFHETYSVVDWFVIYESSRTQSGWKKPLYFRSNKLSLSFIRVYMCINTTLLFVQ